MAYIKTLKDNELVGGTDNKDVYPVSTTQALYSQEADGTVRMSKDNPLQPEKLEERLEDHEEDASVLHQQTEKLVPAISYAPSFTNNLLEIDGNSYTVTLTGSARIETYGDAENKLVNLEDATSVGLQAVFNGSAIETVSGNIVNHNWYVGNYTFTNPIAVGTYRMDFDITYNSIERRSSVSINSNLRKYFGFADTQPTSVEDLITLVGQDKATSNFSNSVACTVPIPANGTGFKRIYLSVPSGMTINRVVQPDALNAPLAITQIGTIYRTIGGTTYAYKLYQSVDLIDSSISKRLTIN